MRMLKIFLLTMLCVTNSYVYAQKSSFPERCTYKEKKFNTVNDNGCRYVKGEFFPTSCSYSKKDIINSYVYSLEFGDGIKNKITIYLTDLTVKEKFMLKDELNKNSASLCANIEPIFGKNKVIDNNIELYGKINTNFKVVLNRVIIEYRKEKNETKLLINNKEFKNNNILIDKIGNISYDYHPKPKNMKDK